MSLNRLLPDQPQPEIAGSAVVLGSVLLGVRAREELTDDQFSALSWLAITMNAFNRVSVISGHPVRPRPA